MFKFLIIIFLSIKLKVQIQKALVSNNKQISFQDLIIAATAKYYNYPLATLNERHFRNINELPIITPERLNG